MWNRSPASLDLLFQKEETLNDPNLIARLDDQYDRKIKLAKRVATIAIAVNVILSVTKLVVGRLAHSNSRICRRN
jgi:hypothetical protein